MPVCSSFTDARPRRASWATILLLLGGGSACSGQLPGEGDDGPNGAGGTWNGAGGNGPGGPGDEGSPGNGDGSGGNGPGVEPAAGCEKGYRELPDGLGGINVERVCLTAESGFDVETSRRAFEGTVYPVLRDYCSSCHSTDTLAQAPIHADSDVGLAHEYALTRVNFKKPIDSKLVVRLLIDRHNCFGANCRVAGQEMLDAVTAWANAVTPTLRETPRAVPADQTISEQEVLSVIAADKATLAAEDREFVKYASLHEVHNRGASADDLNVARAGLSKALNSAARWAPAIVNPVDVDGRGVVYRFDTRDYWGHNKGVTKLHFGGSDDDVFFGRTSTNYLGEPVGQNVTSQERYNYTATVQEDPSFARLVWDRVLAGNVEGATDSQRLPPMVDGFKSEYVEASQLVFTLTRPDVYNAIMAIPWYADALEDELGVIRDRGMDSYEYMLTFQAITVDSRMYWRARTSSGGFYWKTWDVFSGQLPAGVQTIEQAYDQGQIRFPFWANPIPKFVSPFLANADDPKFSFVATLAQPSGQQPAGCDGQPNFGGDQYVNCRWYTGTGGLQQSAEEVIWDLPNGLQGYALFGGFNQRRVDAFVNIVRDPRLIREASDVQLTSNLGFATQDRRLNTGSSCIGCHADGMNRGDNDLRDWLDEGGPLPRGERGVDRWIDDEATVARVRELYPPSSIMRPRMEDDRRRFLSAQAKITREMVMGEDKNVYVEPTIWVIEWAREFYAYPITRSN